MTVLAQPAAPAQPSLPRRISLHWTVRFALTLALYIMFVTLLDWPIFTLLGVRQTLIADLLTGVVDVLAAIVIVTLLVERRPLGEIGLGLRGLLPAWGRGFLLGAGYAATAVALLALLGAYRVTAVNLAPGPLLSAFALHLVIGLLCRAGCAAGAGAGVEALVRRDQPAG